MPTLTQPGPGSGPPFSLRHTRVWRRALLWAALLALLVVAQGLLLALTLNYESTRAQDDTESTAAEAASEVRREMLGAMQALQALAVDSLLGPASDGLQAGAKLPQRLSSAANLLAKHPSLGRVELRNTQMAVLAALDAPASPALFSTLPRKELQLEAEWACAAARRANAPIFSRSYFVPLASGQGQEVVDICTPVLQAGQEVGLLVGSLRMARLLETALPPRDARRHEFSFVEGDGTRVARAGLARGAGVYVAERVVDIPGSPLLLRADSTAGRPSLVPNLATSLVMGLSLALFGVVLLLVRDARRRAAVEEALAESLGFRKAMEDSLPTGLRARDLHGVVTYANPAFCAMVGYSMDELRQARETQPYWPAESLEEYRQRQSQRLANSGPAATESRDGFETVFVRRNGERFPVMIYEAPLVDGQGAHTGWMSAVLDLSAQRRIEELSRQQQDRLQATARLATVGEMASLLSHELNQPLAAIASYASGSLNLLAEPEAQTPALLQQALQRIGEQAERAGRVIKSVHDFVRRREQLHETFTASALIDAVLPLARLQARKSGTRIEVHTTPADGDSDGESAQAAQPAPTVRCDRTMVEQVLLNLTRNGIQAMEPHTPLAQRVLTLRAHRDDDARWVRFSVIDTGPGIAPDVAERLFTPFFTTRAEGMGLGLSLCRTVIEQHGGTLTHRAGPGGTGTEFRFTLPAPRPRENSETPRLHAAV